MRKFLLEHNPFTRFRTTMHANDDEFVVETTRDVQDIVDANRASYAATKRSTPHGEWTRYASIPLHILMELDRKGITRDQRAFKKWLNDPANLAFRTRPGRI